MPSLRDRARAALAARWRELLPSEAFHADGAHVLRFEDALVPSLGPSDVEWARAQLAARAKGELRPAKAGTVQAHAPWSSTALVAGAFAAWRQRPVQLPLGGLGPFAELRLEERLHIPHGGGTPNLDVALPQADGVLVGIESKLTEHLAGRAPRPWKPAYRRPAMAAALDDGWATLFGQLLDGAWAPRHLDAGQLVRHALSLRREDHLVLLHWEPAGGDELPEVRAHRDEVAQVLEVVGGAGPRLHVLTWAELLDGWAAQEPAHVAALRDRYEVAAGG